MAELKAYIWALALALGLVVWLYFDLKTMKINYEWHSFLINKTTGQKLKPSDMIDLGKIIHKKDAYLEATNSIERLYDLKYQTNLENPFALDQVYTYKQDLEQSAWPVANQTKCANHIDWILEQLSAHKDYALMRGRTGHELTQLIDSFGKPESGTLSGLVTWPGSYEQCKRLTLRNGEIKTRYCMGRLKLKWWPTEEAANPKTRIKLGLCLPESCDTQSFEGQRRKIGSLIRIDMNEFFAENLELDSMFCLPDERSPLRRLPKSGRVYLYLVGSWLVLVSVASILHEIISRKRRRLSKQLVFVEMNNNNQAKSEEQSNELDPSRVLEVFLSRGPFQRIPFLYTSPGQNSKLNDKTASSNALELTLKLLEALSIHNSVKAFKSNAFLEQRRLEGTLPDESPRGGKTNRTRVDLTALSSIKFMMAILVVLAHSCYLTSVYARSISHRIEMNVNGGGRIVLSVGRCVDTFFVFFGVLTAYTLLRKFSVKQLSSPIVWLGVNLGILLRISPVFMLIYWFSRSISPYLGEGPWWDYGVFRYSMKGNCMHEPWWKSILYFGCSGSPPVAGCVLPAWFLVSYSQLSLLMPLVIYLMCKLPGWKSKWGLLSFVSIISSLQLALKMYAQTSFKEEAFGMYGGFVADLLEKFESTGTMATLGRVGCVCVGCYVGYLLRMYEVGKIPQWPNWLRSRLTVVLVIGIHCLIVFLPLIDFYIAKISGARRNSTMNEFVISYVATMLVWPILNSILLIQTTTVLNRSALIRFLGHSFWHSANKLGLCIYLIHWEIIFLGVTSFEQAPSMGFITDALKMWAFGVFFSIIFAFLIHILVEAPTTALIMALAGWIQTNFVKQLNDDEGKLGRDQTTITGKQCCLDTKRFKING